MKKLLILLSISLVCLMGCACTSYETPKEDYQGSSFVVIDNSGDYYIVYNKQTKVMYTVSSGVYNVGTFTLLVNADGTPMVYEE